MQHLPSFSRRSVKNTIKIMTFGMLMSPKIGQRTVNESSFRLLFLYYFLTKYKVSAVSIIVVQLCI
jgi:hypothetical protein